MNNDLAPAITSANPAGFFTPMRGAFDNNKSLVTPSRNIDEFRHNAVDLINAVKGKAGSRTTATKAAFGVSPYPASAIQAEEVLEINA